MERQKHTQTVVIAVLAVAILMMTIGFAATAYTQTLNIGGTDNTTVKAAKWSVHFDTTKYTETTGSVEATTHNVSETSMTYTVTLTKPGDYYEFTIDAVNDGTFDANLKKITLSSLGTAEAKYLTYKLWYNGTEYSATTDNITGVTLANTSGRHPVKVRVEYVQPNADSDLPATDQTITLTASLDYEQAQ